MTTRLVLSGALKRSLPRQRLILPQKRGLAAHADDETSFTAGGTHQAHGHDPNAYSKNHNPVSAALMWGDEFWRNVPVYGNVSKEQFLSYRWQVSGVPSTYPLAMLLPPIPVSIAADRVETWGQTRHTIDNQPKLFGFLESVLPEDVPDGAGAQSKEEFVADVISGVKSATMSLRITHVNSLARSSQEAC
jgi:hypothetical protein